MVSICPGLVGIKMPVFKTIKEAEKYGEKNYFIAEYTQTIHGSWEVRDQYDKEK